MVNDVVYYTLAKIEMMGIPKLFTSIIVIILIIIPYKGSGQQLEHLSDPEYVDKTLSWVSQSMWNTGLINKTISKDTTQLGPEIRFSVSDAHTFLDIQQATGRFVNTHEQISVIQPWTKNRGKDILTLLRTDDPTNLLVGFIYDKITHDLTIFVGGNFIDPKKKKPKQFGNSLKGLDKNRQVELTSSEFEKIFIKGMAKGMVETPVFDQIVEHSNTPQGSVIMLSIADGFNFSDTKNAVEKWWVSNSDQLSQLRPWTKKDGVYITLFRTAEYTNLPGYGKVEPTIVDIAFMYIPDKDLDEIFGIRMSVYEK